MAALRLQNVKRVELPIPGADPWFAAPKDPALTVMTDFRERASVTVSESAPVDAALDHMKHAGVRSAFVIHAQRRVVVGLVTAHDLMGDKPVRHMEEQRVPRKDVHVRDIMVPLTDVASVDIREVEAATVADVARLFDASDLTHLAVTEPDEQGSVRLRGLLSAARVRRLLAR